MKPAARVTLDGVDKTTTWSSVLESISVTDNAGIKSDTCELAFDNRERFDAPPIGAEVQVWIGYEPAPVYMGRYRVDSWTKTGRPYRLTVSASAVDLTGNIRAPKMRSFHEETVKSIVDKIAKDHGLKAVVDAGIGARTVEHIDQQTESDMSFLTRLARRQGATFKLADGKILFAAKGSRKKPSGSSKTAITIIETQASSWTASTSERGDYKSASAQYMDHVAGKRRTARVGGAGKPCHRDRRLYGSKAEAEAAAKACLGDLTRGKVSVTIEMPGDPRMFAEALIEPKGFDRDVDGSYFAKSVTHTFGGSGYTTSVQLEAEGSATETAP